MNAGNIMQGQWPKATDVSPWYGVDPAGVVPLTAQGEWKFAVKFGTHILIIRHTIYLIRGLPLILESMTIAKKLQVPLS